MTTFCVCGSRAPAGKPYTDVERGIVKRVLEAFFKPGDRLIQGGCIDVDSWAMEIGHEMGLFVTTLLPRNDKFTNKEAVVEFSHTIVATGLGYHSRDTMEVSDSDKVIAFPCFERERSSRWSGTWHTWQEGKIQKKDAAVVLLRGLRSDYSVEGRDAQIAIAALGVQPTLL